MFTYAYIFLHNRMVTLENMQTLLNVSYYRMQLVGQCKFPILPDGENEWNPLPAACTRARSVNRYEATMLEL